jgi:hypothetical protein
MPRSKLSAEKLKANGAKPFRVRRRLAEEERARRPRPEVQAYLAASDLELDTFLKRRFDGETISRCLDGSKFTWPEDHWLTRCRKFALESLANPECGDWTREISTRFIRELETGANRGFYMDVVGADNVRLMYEAWQTPETNLTMLRMLEVVEWLCWKLVDGETRHPNEWLLDFHPKDIAVIDPMIFACREHDAQAS